MVDTGVGIEPSQIPTLFTLFGKLRRTAEQNAEGLGFGLMISKALAEENNGEIHISSAGEAEGCDISFTM